MTTAMALWGKTEKNHGKLQLGEMITQARMKSDASHIQAYSFITK
jgi:hypothetical protein